MGVAVLADDRLGRSAASARPDREKAPVDAERLRGRPRGNQLRLRLSRTRDCDVLSRRCAFEQLRKTRFRSAYVDFHVASVTTGDYIGQARTDARPASPARTSTQPPTRAYRRPAVTVVDDARAEIPLRRAREDDHHELPRVLRPRRHLQRRPRCGAAADAARNPLFPRDLPRPLTPRAVTPRGRSAPRARQEGCPLRRQRRRAS